jgi:hypothetical protein
MTNTLTHYFTQQALPSSACGILRLAPGIPARRLRCVRQHYCKPRARNAMPGQHALNLELTIATDARHFPRSRRCR